MDRFDDHNYEMMREEELFNAIVTKISPYSNRQLIDYGAKAIADIFNAVVLDDLKLVYEDQAEETALDFVALILISFGGLIVGREYSSKKRTLVEKLFKKSVSLTEMPSAKDLEDICEALFENENTSAENAELFNLLYSDSRDYDCELAHRLYILGIVISMLDKKDDAMLAKCKEELEVMGLHRYVNHKFDTPFIRDTKTGESYYSYDVDMGGESA
ncbi:MAG: hypothetical protein MJ094_05915 [Saccharofermentans sp.]|nr:hypothetical protein [Saccharofermentans sp.]